MRNCLLENETVPVGVFAFTRFSCSLFGFSYCHGFDPLVYNLLVYMKFEDLVFEV